MPLKIPVMATVPNGPALNVCGGAAVESGAVMEGVGSGAGVEGAVPGVCAAACPESSAGACANACCPRADRLNTAISTNVRRPPHCFFKVKLLSHFCLRQRSIIASPRNLRVTWNKDQRNFSIELIQKFSYGGDPTEKSMAPMQKTSGSPFLHVSF